jgi:NTP pyrophosphatase (non-canonical NTP hydrolase)
MMINKIREEWNAKVDVPMNDKPTLIHQDQSILMFKLMYEELLEYRDAIQKGDIVEIADALGDIQYLLNGTVNQHGLQDHWSQVQEEIHRSNLTKLVDGKLIKREDGKVLKPDTYERPNLKDILLS